MTVIRLGTGITAKQPAAYPGWLRSAEAAGFDLLVCGDSPALWADCFSMLSVAALVTERPRLAVTVTNPVTRHPVVAASAAAAIAELSGGRFRYGLASGDSALRTIGEAPATVAELAEYARAVRGLTRGAEVAWRGRDLALGWVEPNPGVPLWLAAGGPRTLRLAGQIADGVILANSLTPERLALARHHLAEGAAAAGRSLDDIEIWCMCNLVFAPSEDEGVERVRAMLAGTAHHLYRTGVEGKGLPADLHDAVRGLVAEYDSHHHAAPGTSATNDDLVDRYGLRSYLAGLGTVAGPPDHCARRLRQLAESGAANLLVSDMSAAPDTWLRTVATDLRPALREAASPVPRVRRGRRGRPRGW